MNCLFGTMYLMEKEKLKKSFYTLKKMYMKKKIFICPATYDTDLNSDMEIPSGVSMTLPDESMTISEILERFTHGIGADIAEFEDNDDDATDFDDMNPIIQDYTDYDDIISEISDIQKLQSEALKKEKVRKGKGVSDITKHKEEGIGDEGTNDDLTNAKVEE